MANTEFNQPSTCTRKVIMSLLPTSTHLFKTSPIRVVMSDKGALFVATDVCSAMGLRNTSSTLEKLGDENKAHIGVQTMAGSRRLLCINEEGLTHLTYSSRKPIARELLEWAQTEVLRRQDPQEESSPSAAPFYGLPEESCERILAVVQQEVTAWLRVLDVGQAIQARRLT